MAYSPFRQKEPGPAPRSVRALLSLEAQPEDLGFYVPSSPLQGDPSLLSPPSPRGDPASACADVSGDLQSAGVVAMLLCSCYAYNAVFLGKIVPADGQVQSRPYVGVAFNIFLGLTLWCWLQAHLADPAVPETWRRFAASVGYGLHVVPAQRAWQPGLVNFCHRCGGVRPERAHHCSRLNRCVLRMDHYCPWVNNCIGFANYKYFLLTLVYGSILSFVVLATTWPSIVRYAMARWQSEDGEPLTLKLITTSDAAVLGFLGLQSLVMTVLLQQMAAYHTSMAAYNRTQLEAGYINMPNPYCQSSWRRNIAQVFGAPGVDWLLPIRPWHPLSDGIAYRRQDQGFREDIWPSSFGEDTNIEVLWRICYNVQETRVRDDDDVTDPLSWAGCTKEAGCLRSP